MNQSELKIQCEIVAYLQTQNIMAVYIPNELSKGNVVATMQAITAGLRPGAADLFMFYPHGTVTFLEVKTPTGKQSDKQKKFQKHCEEHGLAYHVVRSVQDVSKIIGR